MFKDVNKNTVATEKLPLAKQLLAKSENTKNKSLNKQKKKY